MNEELIEHWTVIIKAVFRAEENIQQQWEERLKAAKNLSNEEKNVFISDYLRAIATEIVTKGTPVMNKEELLYGIVYPIALVAFIGFAGWLFGA